MRFKCIRFKIDTGADVTVIPENIYENLGKPELSKSTKNLLGPGEKALNVLGKFTETLLISGKSIKDDVYVVRGLQRCLLGRPAIVGLQLIELNFSEELFTHESVKVIHPSLFKEIGSLEGEYKIALSDDAKHYALSVPRRVAIPMLPKVKTELQLMESQSVKRVSKLQPTGVPVF